MVNYGRTTQHPMKKVHSITCLRNFDGYLFAAFQGEGDIGELKICNEALDMMFSERIKEGEKIEFSLEPLEGGQSGLFNYWDFSTNGKTTSVTMNQVEKFARVFFQRRLLRYDEEYTLYFRLVK